MANDQAWPCSSCVYWQPYPSWEGVGTCDNPLSRSYSRMTMGMGEHCEYSTPQIGPVLAGSRRLVTGENREPTTCESCHYWLPFGTMPQVGECDNSSSRHFKRPTFSDKPTEDCFVARSLEELEFMWCQTHRQTIHASDVPDHRGCGLFASSVSLPVEDEMEFTLAGD